MEGAVLVPPRYRDLERLAGGGMAEVYRAFDRELERPVAIKLLAAADAGDGELRQRFAREALAAARLSGQPHTVTIYDVGEWRGRPYLVMEYLAGGSLEQRIHAGRVTSGQALGWLTEAASALDHAHAQGVVHRDVKPANLLFDGEGVLHVADFGIASATGLRSLTQTGTVLGTAGYLAPEQAAGRRATAAADRYALAVVAFELLAGQRPYMNQSPTAEAAAHLHAGVPRISALNPDLPAGADAVFSRALAKSPEARPGSCAELVQSIGAVLDSADAPTVRRTAATLVSPPASAAPPRDRTRRRWATAVALLAVLAGGTALALLLAGTLSRRVPTIQAAGSTRTVTVSSPTTANTKPSNRSTATVSGADLTRRAEALIRDGNYQAALPLLQQAVRQLQPTNTSANARASYDLAYTLAQLGECDSAIPLLDRVRTFASLQAKADQLLALCTGPPGHRPGHGDGSGNGNGNSQS